MRPDFNLLLTTPRLRMTAITADCLDVIAIAMLAERDRVAAAFASTLLVLEKNPIDYALESRSDWEAGTRYRLAIWQGTSFLGLVLLREIDWDERSAELAYLLLEHAEGKGLAYEATSKVVQWAGEELGLEDLWARILAGNTRSEKLAAKLAFVHDPRPSKDYTDAHGVCHKTQRYTRANPAVRLK